MNWPAGNEIAWFFCGVWATFFLGRAGRARESGFFAMVALVFVAAAPAVALMLESDLTRLLEQLQRTIRSMW